MDTPHAVFVDNRGRRHTLRPGNIIGRAVVAACRLDEPRISEAHAMLSLRGELRLLALRGTLTLDGIEDDDFPLEAGQEITLADGVTLSVEEVVVPAQVLALKLGGEVWALRAPSYSLLLSPQPQLVPRYLPAAAARVWSGAEGWLLQVGDSPAQLIRPGRTWSLGDRTISVVLVATHGLSAAPTVGRIEPLNLVVRFTTVHIHRPRREPALIDGLPGRLLSELALSSSPVPWEPLARGIWTDAPSRQKLRKRWDRVRQRLTAQLRDNGIRDDLVRTDNSGNFEVLLLPGDRVTDES